MNTYDKLKTELDRYEAAHGTERRHPDGRLESRQMIALIGRAVLDLAARTLPPEVVIYVDTLGREWRQGAVPGTAICCGVLYGTSGTIDTTESNLTVNVNDVNDAQFESFRKACAVLWPDYERRRL